MASGDHIVNTTSTFEQHSSSVAVLADGSFVVAWCGPGPGDQSYMHEFQTGGVFFQRYNAAGEKVGGEILVNTNVAPENRMPEVVALDGGGFAIAWIELTRSEHGQTIEYFTRAYNASGSPERGPVKVHQQFLGKENDYAEDRLDLIATPDGGFMVTFASADWTPNPEVEAGTSPGNRSGYDPVVMARQKFSATGSKVGSNEILEDVHAPGYYQNGGPLFLDSDNIYYGNWSSGLLSNDRQVYVWAGNYYQKEVRDEDDNVIVPGYGNVVQDGDVEDTLAQGGLYYRIVDSSGSPTTVVRMINDSFLSADFPDLAVLNNNKFVVVWLQAVGGGDYEIHGQMFGSNGDQSGDEFVISDSGEINQDSAPKVVKLSDGRFVVAWDQVPGANDHKIMAQLYNANGTADGGVVELAAADRQLTKEFDIVATSDGGFMLSWDEGKLDASEVYGLYYEGDVYLKRFDADGRSVDLGSSEVPVDRDTLVKMKEDKTFSFHKDDFGFDDGAFASIKVKSLPKNGTLKLEGQKVEVGDSIKTKDIADLTFRPNKDWFGKTSFDFQDKVAGSGLGDQFTFTFKVTDVLDVITGNKKDNDLGGTRGKDKISGLKGDDTLTGKQGKDIFVFKTGWGKDTITDFHAKGNARDKLDLKGVKSIKSFKDLMNNHIEKQGKHVLIDAGNGDKMLLKNIKIADLDSGDFLI